MMSRVGECGCLTARMRWQISSARVQVRAAQCFWAALSPDKKATMNTAKHDVELLLNKLPDNSSVEDIQYHLYVFDKVRRGLEDARVQGVLSQEDVESRLAKWLSE